MPGLGCADNGYYQVVPVTRVDRVANYTALTAAALSASAGLLHIAVTRTHLAESAIYGFLMLIAAWIQLGFAVALLIAPKRSVRLTGAAALLAIVAGWAISRINGLPFGHSQGVPEEVRLLGTVATVLGALAALTALAGARPRAEPTAATRPPSPIPVAAAGVALAALVSFALLLTPPGHSGGHGGMGAGHSGATNGNHRSGNTGGAGTGVSVAPTPGASSGETRHDDGHTHAPGEEH